MPIGVHIYSYVYFSRGTPLHAMFCHEKCHVLPQIFVNGHHKGHQEQFIERENSSKRG